MAFIEEFKVILMTWLLPIQVMVTPVKISEQVRAPWVTDTWAGRVI